GHRLAWVPLGPAAPVDAAVKALSPLARDRQFLPRGLKLDDVKSLAHNGAFVLLTQVWDKLAPHLTGAKAVLIVPDGDLTRVPWAALPGGKKGTYLIEEVAIATASHGQALAALLRQEPAGQG